MISALGPPLAAGNVAEVYAWGEGRVLKLYKPAPWAKRTAFREASNQAAAEAMGLPVPAVHGVIAEGERWGVVSDRVEGASFAERLSADPATISVEFDALVALQLRLQRSDAPFFAGMKQRLAAHIDAASELAPRRKRVLLAGLKEMPDGDRLCHFDFHAMNVMGSADRPVVIDWCDACRGPAPADACRSYVLIEIHYPPMATPYLERYCQASGWAAEEVLSWRPYMLAAKLIETPAEAPRLLALLDALGR
jgi:aminoglycoside phosphotransferase (APT) family kinase protein